MFLFDRKLSRICFEKIPEDDGGASPSPDRKTLKDDLERLDKRLAKYRAPPPEPEPPPIVREPDDVFVPEIIPEEELGARSHDLDAELARIQAKIDRTDPRSVVQNGERYTEYPSPHNPDKIMMRLPELDRKRPLPPPPPAPEPEAIVDYGRKERKKYDSLPPRPAHAESVPLDGRARENSNRAASGADDPYDGMWLPFIEWQEARATEKT